MVISNTFECIFILKQPTFMSRWKLDIVLISIYIIDMKDLADGINKSI